MKKTLKRFSLAEANVAPDDFIRKYQLKGIFGGIIGGGYECCCGYRSQGDCFTINNAIDRDHAQEIVTSEQGQCGQMGSFTFDWECWTII